MTSSKVFWFLVFLLVCLIEDVKCRKKYCQVSKNQYYVPSGDICKKCDKCMPGRELEPMEKATFDITADHGAMGCRSCVRCRDGFYSIKRSFGSCKKCKDCEAIGKVTKSSCTSTSNSKCGKKKRKPEVITPIDIVQMTTILREESTKPNDDIIPTTQHSANVSTAATDYFRYNKTVFMLVAFFSISVAILMAIMVYLCLNQKRQCKGINWNEPENNQSVRMSDISPTDIEEDGGEPDDTVPCIGNSTYNDYEITEENKFPTDKQLMFISKYLAPKEGYREVALELSVPENDISIIEEENQRCQSRSYKVLQKWVQLFSEQATVTKLLHTLEHVGKRDVIDKFRQEYIDIFINTSRHTPTVLAN